MNPRGLERVRELFFEQIGNGLHPGAALAVYRYGIPVLDLYGGLADKDTGREVDERHHVRPLLFHQAGHRLLSAYTLGAGDAELG